MLNEPQAVCNKCLLKMHILIKNIFNIWVKKTKPLTIFFLYGQSFSFLGNTSKVIKDYE